MKRMIPIFHTEFDAKQLLVNGFGEIPPSGDFGGFLVAILATLATFPGWIFYFLPILVSTYPWVKNPPILSFRF